MSKYRVVNFSGTPYGTPTEMCKNRQAYLDRHLNGTKNYALNCQIATLCNSPDQQKFIFIDVSVVNAQLNQLLLQVDALHNYAETMDGRKKQQAIFHAEQVIGRVARILNRPQDPTQQQKQLYLDNVQETLKLAAELSIHENTWTLRKIGRLLMLIAAVAAMTAIVSYVVFSAAPVAIIVAVCSALLGGLGLYFQKFSSPGSLKETLSNIAYNVAPFPDNGHHACDPSGSGSDNPDGPNGPNNYHPNGYRIFRGPFSQYLDESKISSYLSSIRSKVPDIQLYPYGGATYSIQDISAQLITKINDGLNHRLASGDNEQELHDQLSDHSLSDHSRCERLAALSDVAIIPINGTVLLTSMEELIAEGELDPLGAENPTEALQNAFHKVVIKHESQSTSPMTMFTDAVNAVCSFFRPSDQAHRQNEQDEVNREQGWALS